MNTFFIELPPLSEQLWDFFGPNREFLPPPAGWPQPPLRQQRFPTLNVDVFQWDAPRFFKTYSDQQRDVESTPVNNDPSFKYPGSPIKLPPIFEDASMDIDMAQPSQDSTLIGMLAPEDAMVANALSRSSIQIFTVQIVPPPPIEDDQPLTQPGTAVESEIAMPGFPRRSSLSTSTGRDSSLDDLQTPGSGSPVHPHQHVNRRLLARVLTRQAIEQDRAWGFYSGSEASSRSSL